MDRLVGVLLLVTLIGSSTLGVTLTHTPVTTEQPVGSEWERTADLIELASTSRSAANRSLTFATEQRLNATIIAAARQTYRQGTDALAAANASLYGTLSTLSSMSSNHTLARQLALDAMHLFRATLEQLAGLWEATSMYDTYDKLLDTIRRLEAYRSKVQTLIIQAKTAFPQYNYTDIDLTLRHAERHLVWAKRNVTAFLLDPARSEVDLANQTLDLVTTQLHNVAAAVEVKKERILQFIEGSLTDLNSTLVSLAQDTGQDITTEAAAIRASIEAAQQQLETDNLQGAMAATLDAYRLLVENIARLTAQTAP